VAVIDPAPAVARELRRRLTAVSQLAPDDAVADERYFTTGDPEQGSRVMSQLLGRQVVVARV
jgi:glutamate racemase